MAAPHKFNCFSKDLADKKHNFGSDTFKIMLSNTAPIASNAVNTDITEITAGSGYSAGGAATTLTESTAAGTYKVVGSTVVFTASGGSVGPFRYAVLYNDTSATNALICWWDNGDPITLASGEAFTVVFDATNGILQIA
jgi:hypothetical protein